jgi:hypothetical protein
MASVNTTLDREYDYDTYTYLAILLTPSSPFLADPSRVHPHLKHLGPVRHDTRLYLIRSSLM